MGCCDIDVMGLPKLMRCTVCTSILSPGHPSFCCPVLPPALSAALRNLFENTAAIQFNHRMLAYSTLAGVAGLWRYGSRLTALPPPARLLLHALLAATGAQVRRTCPAALPGLLCGACCAVLWCLCRPRPPSLYPASLLSHPYPKLSASLPCPCPCCPLRRWHWASPPCSPTCLCPWGQLTRREPWCCSPSC